MRADDTYDSGLKIHGSLALREIKQTIKTVIEIK
jgi:hypothetical protein